MSAAPPPRVSLEALPYWEACALGKLSYQHCLACDEPVFHPRALCPYCLQDALEWRRSAGRGAVYSFSVQHVHLRPEPGQMPRALGIAALDEGFHMFTEFLADRLADIRVGARLAVTFEAAGGGFALPKFRIVP